MKLGLIRPTKEHQNAAIKFISEFYKFNSEINGTGGLDGYLDKEAIEFISKFYRFNSEINGTEGLDGYLDKYDAWLKKLEEDRTRIATAERVPAETYFLMDTDNNKIIGIINIRLELNDYLKNFGGNIGYSIRPTERRKGYNKINLYLGLLKCKEHGLDKIIVDCSVNNIGSDKTILALGGNLIKTAIDPYDNTLTNVYWIDVNKSINDNKELYEPFIEENINFNKKYCH